jgi:hypothetical protein
MSGVERALPILAAILLVRLVASEAQYQRARRSGNTIRFPAGLGLRVVLGLGSPFMLYVAYRLALDARNTGEWWLPVMAVVFGIATGLCVPAEIIIDEQGISQSLFLGLRKRIVRWDGASARHVPGLREVLVIGSDGTVIKHSQHHVGQAEFLFQLQKHKVFLQS